MANVTFDDLIPEQPAAKAVTFDDLIPERGTAKPPAKPSLVQEVAGAMANFNRGLYLGDEVVAGAKTVGNALAGRIEPKEWKGSVMATGLNALKDDFDASMAAQRALEDGFTAARPKAAALARGTGNATAAALPGAGSMSLAPNASVGMNALRGGVTSALAGSAMTAMDRGSVRERVDAATDPATLAIGAGLGAAGAGLALLRPSTRLPKVSRNTMRAEKDAAYRAVDNSGVTYRPGPVAGLADVIETELRAANFNSSRHPKTASILRDEIAGLRGSTPTPTQLDQLRQVVRRDVIKSGDPSEQRLGQMIIAQIDDFISVAGPKQVSAGDPRAAAASIQKARDLNTRISKIDAVDKAVEKAKMRAGSTGSGGNTDNAIRQNLRVLMEKTPNLTAGEREAFERVIMGTGNQNALRQLGKLSPQGNGLMFAGHLFAAGATGGKSAALAGVGAGAKAAADAITLRNVDDLVRIIAAGGRESIGAVEQLQALAAHSPGLREQIAARIATAAGAMTATAATAAHAEPIEMDIGRSQHPDHLEWRRRQGLN